MTVTFCGHHDAYLPASALDELTQIIIGLINEGADRFLLGGYGNFDSLAATAVLKAKEQFPNIKSILVIPYLDRDFDKKRYDESVFPPLESVPKRFAISKRNNWMVEKSDVVIAYITHDWGGAYNTFAYAEKQGKRIIRFKPQ